MSRIGNQPIEIPSGVSISIEHPKVTVKGPKGELSDSFHEDMTIVESDGIISVSRPSDESEHKAWQDQLRGAVEVEGLLQRLQMHKICYPWAFCLSFA